MNQVIMEAARARLLGMLEDMSEDAWCCTWFRHVEHYVWNGTLGGQRDDEYRADEYRDAKELGTALGGWWVMDNDADECRWVEMAEWLKIHEAWQQEQKGDAHVS